MLFEKFRPFLADSTSDVYNAEAKTGDLLDQLKRESYEPPTKALKAAVGCMRKYIPIRPYLDFLLRADLAIEEIAKDMFAVMREELTAAK